jgi:hypothetical protein
MDHGSGYVVVRLADGVHSERVINGEIGSSRRNSVQDCRKRPNLMGNQ